nr:EpsG family protein [Photobacterium damselae]
MITLFGINKVKYKKILIIIFSLFLSIPLIFKTTNVDTNDLSNYISIIEGNNSRDIETSFLLISDVTNLISDSDIKYSLVLMVYVLPALLIKLLIFNKESRDFNASCLIYFSSFFFIHEFVQIRTALALGFVLLAIYQDRIALRILFFLLAAIFHVSSLIILPFLVYDFKFYKRKMFIFLYATSLFVALFVKDKLQYVLGYAKEYNIYNGQYLLNESHIKLFPGIMYPVIFVLLSFFILDYTKNCNFNKNEKIILNIFFFSIPCYWLFSFSSVLAFRSFEFLVFFSILAIPSLFKNIKQRYFVVIIYSSILFYYYIFSFKIIGHFELNFL